MQGLFIEVFIFELFKRILTEDQRAIYSKTFGYLGGSIIMYFNYKKHNGKYNQYRYYWKDEAKKKRILKGFGIILSLLLPIVLLIIFGVHWNKS